MGKYNMFDSSSVLNHVGITLRGRFPSAPPPQVEPEPDVWVVLEVSSCVDVGIKNEKHITKGEVIFDKNIYLSSNSNFLDDVFTVIEDNLDNDSVVTSDILHKDDNGSSIIQFMRANGFPLSPDSNASYDLVTNDIYMKPPSLYWYGEQLNKYLNSTQVDFGGKMFTQYTSDDVLPEYEELFNLDKHEQRQCLKDIVPEHEYSVNLSNNTAYGIGGRNKHDQAAFLSIGWACKMAKSEFDNWKSYCNTVRLENAIVIPPSKNWISCSNFTWIEGTGRYIGSIYTYRVAVISGNLLRS